MNNNLNILCIIPARGGSKGVPKKNIKLLGNIPLIGYSINSAKESNYINKIIVSTDCKEIRDIALNLRKTYIQQQMGREFAVLAEEGGHGLTTNYIRVRCDGAKQGEVTTVILNEETLAERIKL